MKKRKSKFIVVVSILLVTVCILNRNMYTVDAKTKTVHSVESYVKHSVSCNCGNGELVILETVINNNKAWYLLNSTCDCFKCSKDDISYKISTYVIPCHSKREYLPNFDIVLNFNIYEPYDRCIIKLDFKPDLESSTGYSIYNIIDIGEILHIEPLGIYALEVLMMESDND